MLSAADALVPGLRLDVRLQVLEHAPRVRDHGSVTVHLGAASVPARVRTVFASLDEPTGVEGGEEKVVQLILQRPIVCRPGQRFIVRGHRRLVGQGATLGGGE